MAKVTIKNFLPMHLRAARALLNMSAGQFVEFAGGKLTSHKIRSFENGRPTHHKTRTELLDAIARAGVELQNDGKPGARVTDEEAFLNAVEAVLTATQKETVRLR